MYKSFKKIQQLSSVSSIFLALGLSLGSTEQSSAIELKLLPEDLGFFSSNGFHFADLENYFVGSCSGSVTANNVGMCPTGLLGEELRNFVVFDTQSVSGTNITSATLSLQNPQINVNVDDGVFPNPSILNGFNSAYGSESYRLRSIDSDLGLLIGNNYEAYNFLNHMHY